MINRSKNLNEAIRLKQEAKKPFSHEAREKRKASRGASIAFYTATKSVSRKLCFG